MADNFMTGRLLRRRLNKYTNMYHEFAEQDQRIQTVDVKERWGYVDRHVACLPIPEIPCPGVATTNLADSICHFGTQKYLFRDEV